MKLLSLLFIPGLVSLCACAQSPVAQAPATAPAAPSVAAPGAVPAAPDGGLTGPLLYQFLLGEIAGQRGDLNLASEAYADLARKTRDVRVVRRASELAGYARQSALATEMGTLWVNLEPQSTRARQSLATLLIGAGRFSEAKPHLEAMLRMDDRPVADGFGQMQNVVSHSKDKKAVLDLVKELAGAYPALPEASIAVAQAAHAAGQEKQSLQAIDQALRLNPGWETAALLKGQILANTGEDAVLKYWQAFLDENPKAMRVRLAHAKLLSKAGKYPEAIKEFEFLKAAAPDNPEFEFAIGLLAMQMNDLDAAEKHLTGALAQGYQDESLVQMYLGQLSEGRQRYQTALDWYRKIGRGDAQYFDAQLKAAVVLGKLARVEEGRSLLRGMQVESADEAQQIVQAEAQLLREARRHEEALAVLTEALLKDPNAADLLYDHAMIAEKLGKLDVTEADLRRLIVLRPDHAHAYNALGYTLVDRTKRVAEGLTFLEKALKLSPEDPFILDSMGWALYKAQRQADAVDYLKRAYAARADPEIAAHLGECLWSLGQQEEARKIWQGSLRDHPDDEYLRETLSRFGQ